MELWYTVFWGSICVWQKLAQYSITNQEHLLKWAHCSLLWQQWFKILMKLKENLVICPFAWAPCHLDTFISLQHLVDVSWLGCCTHRRTAPRIHWIRAWVDQWPVYTLCRGEKLLQSSSPQSSHCTVWATPDHIACSFNVHSVIYDW